MSIARRSFLKSAATTTISAGLALTSAHLAFGQQTGRRILAGRPGADSPTTLGDSLANFNYSTFKPYVGDYFQVPNAKGEMVALKLVRAKEFVMSTAPMQKKAGRTPKGFSLTFNGSDPLPPFTSIHKMNHPALGEFDLFLTSRKTDDGSFVYEAVFSQID